MARPVKTEKFANLKTISPRNGTMKRCACCEEEKKVNDFYKINNPLFSDGYYPTCKTCILDQLDETSPISVYDTLRRMDKPFIEDKWTVAETSYEGKAIFGKYLQSINTSNMTNLNWDDSEFPETGEEEDMSGDSKSRWSGFSSSDKMRLESEYQEMLGTYEANTPVQRNIYRDYCITRHKANQAMLAGNISEYEKLQRVLSAQMNDARIKPLQETGFDENSTATFGQFIEKVEKTEPIPEAQGIFRDVDKIKEYITRFFTKQMKLALGLIGQNDSLDNKEKD